MNEDQTLNRGLQIPRVDLNQQQQLQLYHQSQIRIIVMSMLETTICHPQTEGRQLIVYQVCRM